MNEFQELFDKNLCLEYVQNHALDRLMLEDFGGSVRYAVECAVHGMARRRETTPQRALSMLHDGFATFVAQKVIGRSRNVVESLDLSDDLWFCVPDVIYEGDGEVTVVNVRHIDGKHLLWNGRYLPMFKDVAQAWLMGELYLDGVGTRPKVQVIYIAESGHVIFDIYQAPDHVTAEGWVCLHKWSSREMDYVRQDTRLERSWRGRLAKLRGVYEMNLALELAREPLMVRGERDVAEFEWAEWYMRQD